MKKIYLLILYLIILESTAQTLTVSYISHENRTSNTTISNLKNDLILQSDQSLYYTTNPDTSQFINKNRISSVENKDGKIYVIFDGNNSVDIEDYKMYKNYSSDTILYNQSSGWVKNKIIGEPLSPILSWKIITGNDSVILGYNCQKATTSFRGRDYIAYFSSKLAPRGGPWKFDGLPGLIIYVTSKDKYFDIKPYQIVLNQQKPPIINPYQDKSKNLIISWAAYKQMNKTKLEKFFKMMYDRMSIGNEVSVKPETIEDLELGNTTIKK